MVIFAYDELDHGVEPEVEVLSNMLSKFGPLPEGLIEHIQDSVWSQVLTGLDQSFDANAPRKPFSWIDIEGLEPCDKEIFGRILKLDPGLRPPAEELLNDIGSTALKIYHLRALPCLFFRWMGVIP